MTLPAKKIQVIQVAKRQLGLSDDLYRDILWAVAGVESARDLDDAGFDQVMARFRDLGFVSTSRKRYYGDRPGMASARQVKLIRALWREYIGGATDDAALDLWIKRTFHVDSLRFVDAGMAHKVVGALKQMKRRRPEAKAG
jgi:phage gp16-like protein